MGYTQVYTVSQSDSIPLGTNGGTDQGTGVAESASAGNGLQNAKVTKVVVLVVQAHSTASVNGQLGVEIRTSGGTLKYTFANPVTLNSSSPWVSITDMSHGAWTPAKGIQNISIIDNNNSYTMASGDRLIVTWSGSGTNNDIAVSTNSSGPYGLEYAWSGSSFTSEPGYDVAITVYTGIPLISVPILDSVPLGSPPDTIKKKGLKKRTEALGTLTDSRKKKGVKKRTEANGAVADGTPGPVKVRRIPRSDSEPVLTVSDSRKKVAMKNRTETLTISETRKKFAIKKRTEPTIYFTSDSVVRQAVVRLTEAVGSVITGPIAKLATKTRSETIPSISETVKKKSIQAYDLVDNIYLTEAISGFRAIQKVLDELVAVRIALQFHPQSFTESLGLVTDALKKKKAVYYGMTNALSLTESTKKFAKKKAFTEALGTITDTRKLKKIKPLTTQAVVGSVTDSKKKKAILRYGLGTGEPATSITDSMVKKASKPFSEPLGAIGEPMQKVHRFLKAVAEIIRTRVSG